MGLFDEVLSMAGSATGQQTEHAGRLTAIMGYINAPAGRRHCGPSANVSAERLGRGFQSSWVSSGQNLPISADALGTVLDTGALQQAAESAGIDPSQPTGMMSTLLPHLVEKLTPNGQIPDASAFESMLRGLARGHRRNDRERCGFKPVFLTFSERSLRRARPSGRSATSGT